MTTGNDFDDAMLEIARASRGARGCTPDECEKVRQLQGVEHLPDQYSAFLRTMGADPGDLYGTYGLGLQVLQAAFRVAETCCAETGFSLPQQAIILGSHDGYQFFFMDPATGAVMVYSESMNPNGYEVTELAASLVEFLIEYAEVPPS